MKHLSLGLFIAYLLFISSKSFITPVSSVELGVLGCLLLVIVGEKCLKAYYKIKIKEHIVEMEKVNIQRPGVEDPEIVSLRNENEKEALKLRKFMTEQEYHKREIAKAVEQTVGNGGFKF